MNGSRSFARSQTTTRKKQPWKLAEECGELVQALSKHVLTGDKRPVIEEIGRKECGSAGGIFARD